MRTLSMSFACCSHMYTSFACVISNTPCISYYPQLSFCTLSAQMHIVHVICMLSAHVHIICLSSLTLLVYPIIHNLVSTHCLHTCTLSMSSVFAYVHVIRILSGHICTCLSSLHMPYYPEQFLHCLHTCILSMSSVYCLEMHMLCTCHLYCCYLYMYMSSTYYLGIYVLCAHYMKWSLISSFLTDNTNVIHTSSLVLFIYSIMYNLVSAHCLHTCTLSCHLHVVRTCTHHLLFISNTPCIPYYPQLSFCILSTHTCTLSMSSACCPHMHTSCACHL